MKIEYGCGFDFNAILEKEITCNYVKPCDSQGFMYINSTERIDIFKDLLFLANIGSCKQEDSIVTLTHSDSFKENTEPIVIQKLPHSFAEQEEMATLYRVMNNIVLYTYSSITRTLNMFKESHFKGLSKNNNLSELTNQDFLNKHNDVYNAIYDMATLLLHKNITYGELESLKIYKDTTSLLSNIRLNTSKDFTHHLKLLNLINSTDFDLLKSDYRFDRNINIEFYEQYKTGFSKQYNTYFPEKEILLNSRSNIWGEIDNKSLTYRKNINLIIVE